MQSNTEQIGDPAQTANQPGNSAEDNNFSEVKLNLRKNDRPAASQDIFSEKDKKSEDNGDEKKDEASDLSQVVEEEDASDLYYDKELKLLLEDHKRVSKFMMIVSMLLMGCQIAFAVWCLQTNLGLGTWEDSLLINWYHALKIFMNLYVMLSFLQRIRAKQPSTPLGYLSSYITLLFYLGFLFVYPNLLPPNIGVDRISLLVLYAISDWALLLFAWAIQKNVIARRNELFRFEAGGISQDKKDDDLFDVRYLPEEYMSDIQADSDEEDEVEGDASQQPPGASEMASSNLDQAPSQSAAASADASKNQA